MVIDHFLGIYLPSANSEHPVSPSQHLRSLRSIKELEYSPNLRTLYTNAASIVAINCYQYARLLPARVVSVVITSYVNHLLIILVLLKERER